MYDEIHLDNQWIQEFENTDKLYQDFYKDDNYYVTIHFVYVNGNHNIIKIKDEKFLMKTPNVISKEEIIGLLKRNSIDHNIKYTLLSLLKFNITLEPEEIKNFLQCQNIENYHSRFLSSIKNIDTIVFQQTINMFQDLNDLLFILYDDSNDPISHNKTKKIYFKKEEVERKKENRKKSKTIRKQYKAS